MKSTYSSSHLRNHLDESFHMTDDEFEHKRSEYNNDNTNEAGNGKIARGAGIIILLIAILFIIQKYFFPIGPDLSSILRIIPLTGAILVIAIGLGLLTQIRSRRGSRSGREDFDTTAEFSKSGFSYNPHDEKESDYTVGQKTRAEDRREAGSEYEQSEESRSSGEPYGFQAQKRWYRSKEEKILFGVCGGLAERFEVDPTIVRALFALAFLSYGFSLVIYIVLAVVLPKKPRHILT